MSREYKDDKSFLKFWMSYVVVLVTIALAVIFLTTRAEAGPPPPPVDPPTQNQNQYQDQQQDQYQSNYSSNQNYNNSNSGAYATSDSNAHIGDTSATGGAAKSKSKAASESSSDNKVSVTGDGGDDFFSYGHSRAISLNPCVMNGEVLADNKFIGFQWLSAACWSSIEAEGETHALTKAQIDCHSPHFRKATAYDVPNFFFLNGKKRRQTCVDRRKAVYTQEIANWKKQAKGLAKSESEAKAEAKNLTEENASLKEELGKYRLIEAVTGK